jgi:hypothetical protein
MEKRRFSTVFLGFEALFADFVLIFLVFGRNRTAVQMKTRVNCGFPHRSMQAE